MWMLKKKPDEEIEIVSLGEEFGADKYIKKFASQFELKYTEFLPYHKNWNIHCQEPAFLFGKKYSARYYFMSYGKFVNYCDKIVFFAVEEKERQHPIIEMTKKKNKEIIIVV